MASPSDFWKSATRSVTVGHKMATYNSKEDGETANRPRKTPTMNLTEEERDEMENEMMYILNEVITTQRAIPVHVEFRCVRVCVGELILLNRVIEV